MPESERPVPFASAAALHIVGTVALACAILRLVFADSNAGWAVTIAAAIGCSAGYFALAFRRCRAADRRAVLVADSRTQPSRWVRSISPTQGS